MSVHNIDYNVMSQDISKMPVPHAKPLQFKGIKPKTADSKQKKRVRWRDQSGFDTLVDIQIIEANNKGIKCGPGNKDILEHNRGFSSRRPPDNVIDMNRVFKVMLEWNCVWLDEQKKQKEAPPVYGPFRPVPLPSTFANGQEYVKIFLPLMFDELWSSISEDYEKSSDPVPACIQEYSKDPQFVTLRLMALLTDKEYKSDLGTDGTFVKLDLSYDLPASGGSKAPRQINPSFGYVQQTTSLLPATLPKLRARLMIWINPSSSTETLTHLRIAEELSTIASFVKFATSDLLHLTHSAKCLLPIMEVILNFP